MTNPSGMPGRATRARYWVIVFAITLAVIQYIDRVAISQAMPEISRLLKFSDKEAGLVFSAFTLAYALFEIPTGWLGDKIGPRRVLLRPPNPHRRTGHRWRAPRQPSCVRWPRFHR